MAKAKRIFIVGDVSSKPIKLYLNQMPKLAKGFIRLGHDARIFSYCNAIEQIRFFKSKTLSRLFYKSKVDNLISEQVRNYRPDIVYISFARFLDAETIDVIRKAAPNAVFIGGDGDPWPKLQGNRIETAKQFDILTATNDGEFLQDYRDAGVKHCVFMPNMCDPDVDHRYEVGPEWECDILWTGTIKHRADTSETFRETLARRLAKMDNCKMYGCLGRKKIAGFDYLQAISGARVGVNINAYRSIRFCHSDRLTHFLACGTFVMAKRFSGCNELYKDGEHIKYFDEIEEFFEISQWYLKHEDERKKIADAGMRWVHEQFNSVKIAGYLLELAEKGTYNALWL